MSEIQYHCEYCGKACCYSPIPSSPHPDSGACCYECLSPQNQVAHDSVFGKADHYPCAVCGKVLHCDQMLDPGRRAGDDLVCSEACAEDWNERQSEAMFG